MSEKDTDTIDISSSEVEVIKIKSKDKKKKKKRKSSKDSDKKYKMTKSSKNFNPFDMEDKPDKSKRLGPPLKPPRDSDQLIENIKAYTSIAVIEKTNFVDSPLKDDKKSKVLKDNGPEEYINYFGDDNISEDSDSKVETTLNISFNEESSVNIGPKLPTAEEKEKLNLVDSIKIDKNDALKNGYYKDGRYFAKGRAHSHDKTSIKRKRSSRDRERSRSSSYCRENSIKRRLGYRSRSKDNKRYRSNSREDKRYKSSSGTSSRSRDYNRYRSRSRERYKSLSKYKERRSRSKDRRRPRSRDGRRPRSRSRDSRTSIPRSRDSRRSLSRSRDGRKSIAPAFRDRISNYLLRRSKSPKRKNRQSSRDPLDCKNKFRSDPRSRSQSGKKIDKLKSKRYSRSPCSEGSISENELENRIDNFRKKHQDTERENLLEENIILTPPVTDDENFKITKNEHYEQKSSPKREKSPSKSTKDDTRYSPEWEKRNYNHEKVESRISRTMKIEHNDIKINHKKKNKSRISPEKLKIDKEKVEQIQYNYQLPPISSLKSNSQAIKLTKFNLANLPKPKPIKNYSDLPPPLEITPKSRDLTPVSISSYDSNSQTNIEKKRKSKDLPSIVQYPKVGSPECSDINSIYDLLEKTAGAKYEQMIFENEDFENLFSERFYNMYLNQRPHDGISFNKLLLYKGEGVSLKFKIVSMQLLYISSPLFQDLNPDPDIHLSVIFPRVINFRVLEIWLKYIHGNTSAFGNLFNEVKNCNFDLEKIESAYVLFRYLQWYDFANYLRFLIESLNWFKNNPNKISFTNMNNYVANIEMPLFVKKGERVTKVDQMPGLNDVE